MVVVVGFVALVVVGFVTEDAGLVGDSETALGLVVV